MSRLPHQAANGEPALRSRTVSELRRRPGHGHACRHEQRHSPHARLQVPFRARTDRRDRRVSENHTHPSGARARGPGALRTTGDNVMKNARGALPAPLIIMGAAVTLVATADAADSILSGAITSAAGEKLGGVTVS